MEKNREVCIHPSVRAKVFCSQVDMIKVSSSSLNSTESIFKLLIAGPRDKERQAGPEGAGKCIVFLQN